MNYKFIPPELPLNNQCPKGYWVDGQLQTQSHFATGSYIFKVALDSDPEIAHPKLYKKGTHPHLLVHLCKNCACLFAKEP